MQTFGILTERQINVLNRTQQQKRTRIDTNEVSCVNSTESFLIKKGRYKRNLDGLNKGYAEHSYKLKINV